MIEAKLKELRDDLANSLGSGDVADKLIEIVTLAAQSGPGSAASKDYSKDIASLKSEMDKIEGLIGKLTAELKKHTEAAPAVEPEKAATPAEIPAVTPADSAPTEPAKPAAKGGPKK